MPCGGSSGIYVRRVPQLIEAYAKKLLAINTVGAASLGTRCLGARSLEEAPHCFSIRLMPRLRAGSGAYPGRAPRFMNRLQIIERSWFYLHRIIHFSRDSIT